MGGTLQAILAHQEPKEVQQQQSCGLSVKDCYADRRTAIGRGGLVLIRNGMRYVTVSALDKYYRGLATETDRHVRTERGYGALRNHCPE